MNKTIFTGRLTKDPELRRTQDGTAVLTADIAVDDGWGDKKKTYFPTLVFWRHNAEYVAKYAHKGDLLEVSAKYTERKWKDDHGQTRVSKEFQVDEVKNLTGRQADNQSHTASQGFAPSDFAESDEEHGELPF